MRSRALWSGLTLIGLAAIGLWQVSDLDGGSLASLGAAGVPRAAATFVGLIGLILIALALRKNGDGEPVGRFGARGMVVVSLAIAIFAVTIRPFDLGPFRTPGLGLMVAGPLTVFVGGLATHEFRARDLAVLALILTGFCMVLFGDLLGLPIPVFPEALRQLFPTGWHQPAIVRTLAALLVVAGIVLMLLTRRTDASAAAATTGTSDH